MEIALFVIEPTRRRGGRAVRVSGSPGRSAAELRIALEQLLARPLKSLSCDGVLLNDDHLVGTPPLVHGATLTVDPPPRSAAPSPGSARISVVAGPDAGATLELTGTGTTIGRAPRSGLALDDPQLSQEHLCLRLRAGGIELTDLGSTNGTLSHGSPLTGTTSVTSELDLLLGRSRLAVLPAPPPPRPCVAPGDGRIDVQRAPRVRTSSAAPTIRGPRPIPPRQRARMPWVAAVVPLPFAGVLALTFGPQLLLFAALSPVMLLGTWINDVVLGRRQQRRAYADFDVASRAALGRLDQALTAEVSTRHTDSPSPPVVLATASRRGPDLWVRTPAHEDLVTVRLGLGNAPARALWEQGESKQHPELLDVPITIDLGSAGGLGLYGPARRRESVLRSLVGQLATQTSPQHLRMWFLTTEDETWQTTSLLPHAAVPLLAGAQRRTTQAQLDALSALLARNVEPTGAGRRAGRSLEQLVIVPALDQLTARERRQLAELSERGATVGIRLLCTASTRDLLPAACGAILDLREDATATLYESDRRPQHLVPDGVGAWWLDRLCRCLAPLRGATHDADDALPDAVPLLELLDIAVDSPETIVTSWQASRGPTATLGWADGGPWQIDLRREGPHLLVGGTTGSGKSELLQALILSLATTGSPQDTAFVLVDYKGGAAFQSVAGLPHCVGVITDLDPQLADRALASLTAELKRRERRLAEVGARDLEEYRRRNPAAADLPRLVLVVDEFRILADELPDFLDGLVRIAAVGRSLGVHLVLATQRPAGVVSADISANVNLRIALRVRDRADSQDLLDAPEAATIPSDRPGRGLARTGGGDLVHFQGARVSGTSRPAGDQPLTVAPLDEPRVAAIPAAEEDVDLNRLVEAIRSAAALAGITPPPRPWQPPLPSHLPPPDAATDDGVIVGVEDHPEQQCTKPWTWSPDHGSVLVVGASRSGRTTTALSVLLQAARQWSPTELRIHVIGDGPFTALHRLPHLGTIASPDDHYLVGRLIERLQADLSRAEGSRTLLIVDGWERLASADPLSLDPLPERLQRLVRDGRRSGLTCVLTDDRTALMGALPGLASSTLLLRLADATDAGLAGLTARELPTNPPPGRALRVQDRVTLQVCTPTARPDLADLDDVCRELASRWPVLSAVRRLRLKALPDRCALDDLETATPTAPLRLGIGGDEGATVGLDPHVTRSLLVLGSAHSGRTTTLATVAGELVRRRHTVLALDAGGGTLARRVPPGVRCLRPETLDELVDRRREVPDLALVIDGIDRLSGQAEAAVSEIIALLDRDGGFIAGSADLTTMATAFRGPSVELSRRGCGLVLAPRSPHDAEALGVRAPRGLGTNPGRAILVARGRVTPVQVALPR